ncbi:phosphonopyruvate decarboxylase [Paraglaciecola aquimarina]|uniref:Phosphonopyruvate decarboxylase n=1 Tax=Paraglaciecola algarum TaxID=3050085 RepID=A0ABS9D7Z5_9ALTE|nr:phosphonopyruvate decarboxylase [Paraglaciecola sp. G1-23]MCF2948127.1 phosphonopyruvate decarboxylase [Paraglaciecola sp. G1-23]
MMIAPADFCKVLEKFGIDFYTGVPDSLLKNLCAYIDGYYSAQQHIIAANEGNAVALAMGRYMGSGVPAVVYMQNSGLGNAINPLTSLADPQVYSIPMLLIIGWRGEPGVKDEPQHVKQGLITEKQLDILDIPYLVLDSVTDVKNSVLPLLNTMTKQNRPVAILVKKDTFLNASNKVESKPKPASELKREDALSVLLDVFDEQDVVVSTTGKTSREVFELRKSRHQVASDFLTVGGMGHTSSIAMGLALGAPHKRVIAIDGDGSMLMHMGALPIIGCHDVKNLVHIVLNNECHESVGGQPTVAGKINIKEIAFASGYSNYLLASHTDEIVTKWQELSAEPGPILFEIKIAKGARKDLGRPTSSPIENKQAFMRHIKQGEGDI